MSSSTEKNPPWCAKLIFRDWPQKSSAFTLPPQRYHFSIVLVLLSIVIAYVLTLPLGCGTGGCDFTPDKIFRFLTRAGGLHSWVVGAVHVLMFLSMGFIASGAILVDREKHVLRSSGVSLYIFGGCLALSLSCEYVHSRLHTTSFSATVVLLQLLGSGMGIGIWHLTGSASVACSRAYGRGVTRSLSAFNLLSILLLLFLLRGVADDWWLSAVMIYLPRSPYLIPSLVLLGCAVVWHHRSVWINLLACGLVLGPIMELRLPNFNTRELGNRKTSVKIVSCNVQWFTPDFSQILDEISEFEPDVVAFQDLGDKDPHFRAYFADWHTTEFGQFWVGSRYPLRFIGSCCQNLCHHVTATFEVQKPDGWFLLHVVHLESPRDALSNVGLISIITGRGSNDVRKFLLEQRRESRLIREYLNNQNSDLPQLVVGDFNMPVSSGLFQRYWSEFQSAFDVAGFGYGYTVSCVTNKTWPPGVPWVRIDHILADGDWSVEQCHVGTRNGSDHRLIAATLSLQLTN